MTDRGNETGLPRAPAFKPPPDLQARLRAQIAETTPSRTPVQIRVRWALASIPLAALLVLIARHLMQGAPVFRLDLANVVCPSFFLRAGALLVLSVAVTMLAVRSGRRGLGSSARVLLVAAGAAAPLYAAATLYDPVQSTDPAACAAVARLSPTGMPCAAVAITVGALTLAAMVLALRRAVPVAPRLRGAALGASAGLWAGFSLVMHCPAHDWLHLVVGHVLPVAAFALIGALGVERLIRP